MTKVLVISKSLKFSRILDYTLSHYGFTVEVANDFNKASKHLEEIRFSLILLDLTFCDQKLLLQDYPCPVIAIGETYEEVSILEKMYQGVDDYILKPFQMTELRMIMNKQLERKELMAKQLVLGDLRIDVAKNVVMIKDRMISLGKKELEIMIKLTRKAGKIVSSDALLTKQRIATLTKKLEKEAGNLLEIKHISGLGYKLIAPRLQTS